MHGLSLVVESGGYSLAAACGFLVSAACLGEHGLQGAQASVVAAPGLYSTGSVVVIHRLNCSTACGIFPGQESNPHLLCWQANYH